MNSKWQWNVQATERNKKVNFKTAQSDNEDNHNIYIQKIKRQLPQMSMKSPTYTKETVVVVMCAFFGGGNKVPK